jgi:REP element-mobilizing transposase RayT
LAQEAIALVVVESLERGSLLGHYELGPFVIMANHFHVLLFPKTHPSRRLQSLKGTTARQANAILGRTGEAFWQAESYDHWVRNPEEWNRIAAYIEDNPVKAGLVQHPEEYRWSSAPHAPERVEMSLVLARRDAAASKTPSGRPDSVRSRNASR